MKDPFIIDLLELEYDDFYPQYTIRYNIETPINFLLCAENQLKKDFIMRIGISNLKRVRLSCPGENWGLQLEVGEVSRVNQNLSVGDGYTMAVKICWKSKSGIIYNLTDKKINCDDIEIWLEGLDIKFIYDHLFQSTQNYFDKIAYDFQLTVYNLETDVEVTIHLKYEAEITADELISKCDQFTISYNQKSEDKERIFGLVHNWNSYLKNEKLIHYEFDLGSAGIAFLKKFFRFLSKLNSVEKVVIGDGYTN
jgi:hypothetical protein